MIDTEEVLKHQLEQTKNKLKSNTDTTLLGELTGTIAHDLKNPLHACLFYIDELQAKLKDDPIPTDKLEKYAGKIQQGFNKVQTMLTDIQLLQDAKFELTTIVIAPEVQAAINLIQKKLSHKKINLQSDISETLKATLDLTSFKIMILHLLFNAIQDIDDADDRSLLLKADTSNQKIIIQFSYCATNLSITAWQDCINHHAYPENFDLNYTMRLLRCAEIIKKHNGEMNITDKNKKVEISLVLNSD